MADINFELKELQTSAKTYQKALLNIPVMALQDLLVHMHPLANVRGEKVISWLKNNLQLGPYRKRVNEDGIEITGRSIKTYLGSVEQEFDPNEAGESIYASKTILGEEVKNEELARMVLAMGSRSIGENLLYSIWGAKRNPEGKTTGDLFDGFDTITETEITSGNIAEGKGNLIKLTEAITSVNAVDKLKEIYRKADPKLRGVKTKMFIPESIYNAYVDDYKTTGGGLPYNKEFDKVYLEGSRGRCELVPTVTKDNSKYIHLTPQGNMLVGFYQGGATGAKEKIEINRFSSFDFTIAAALYFGVNFHYIDKEMLLVVELAGDKGE